DGHGRFAEDQSVAAGRHDDCVATQRANLHRAHVLRHDPYARTAFIKYWPEEFPEFVFSDQTSRLPAAGLLIERVKQLLPCGRTRKKSPLEERAAEESKIALSFRRAIERHAHAIEQIDNPRRPVAHLEHRRLVG